MSDQPAHVVEKGGLLPVTFMMLSVAVAASVDTILWWL